MSNNKHYQILIIGGGTGGIMTAAQLRRQDKKLTIGLIEPSEKHAYQPAWTLVGAGTFDYDKTIRPEQSVIPPDVDWIKDFAEAFDPQNNSVSTRNSGSITYDYLIVSAGVQMNPGDMPGLAEALGKGDVCSNYTDPKHTWEVLKRFKGGNAVFTQPTTPMRCGGAPQKIMYLAEEFFRKHEIREKSNVVFATPGSVIFGVEDFRKTLDEIIEKRNIIFKPHYAPVKIDSVKKIIYFKLTSPDNATWEANSKLKEVKESEGVIAMPYDILHLAPPQSAPDFVRNSPLAYADGPNKGWLEVDINTLQHKRYSNVFCLGDSAALPTAKTGAAIRKQAPVVVGNILHLLKDNKLSDKIYEGYSSCPLVTGYGKMVLAEFKYNNVRDSDPLLSKFFDTSKELWSMWILKKYGLPYLYWNQMLKGKM